MSTSIPISVRLGFFPDTAAPMAVDEFDLSGLLLRLAKTPVTEVAKRTGPVVVLRVSDSLKDAFQILVKANFLSAPVTIDGKRFVGWLTIAQLATFVIDLFGKSGLKMSADAWSTFFREELRFQQATIADVLGYSPAFAAFGAPRLPQMTLAGFSTLHVFELLARTKERRAAVLTPEGNVTGLVTTSMIVRLLNENAARLGPLRQMRIGTLKYEMRQKVVSVREDTLVIDALRLLNELDITGLAVVDWRGVLVDTFSIRDLRGIGTEAEKYHRLWFDLKFFKTVVREEFKQQTPERPIFVKDDDTFGLVLELMEAGRLHRIWVAELGHDMRPRPTAVISQRDVLLAVLYYMGMRP